MPVTYRDTRANADCLAFRGHLGSGRLALPGGVIWPRVPGLPGNRHRGPRGRRVAVIRSGASHEQTGRMVMMDEELSAELLERAGWDRAAPHVAVPRA
jgi:hypothetical protein